ncbi:MAG: YWFCY domain-containing protein [Ginsengibacter sp.]
MSSTGENEQGLRKFIDLTRFGSIFILLLHFYFFCYAAFEHWNIQSTITDRLLQNIMHTGLFKNLFWSKLIALGLLIISLLGAQGKLEEKINKRSIAAYCAIGGLLFFGSGLLFQLKESMQFIAVIYMGITGLGFLLIIAGGNLLSRLIKLSFTNDVFNSLNETFPQQENLLLTEYSINPPHGTIGRADSLCKNKHCTSGFTPTLIGFIRQ